MSDSIPPWLRRNTVEIGWPVRDVTDDTVWFSAAVPAAWTAATHTELGAQNTYAVTGPVPGEGLTVTLLRGADPTSDITAWLELPMAAAGGLDPQTISLRGTSALRTWQTAPTDGLAEHLDTDEARAYTGTATFTADGVDRPELIRSYVLLARRGTTAWKIGLALSSASPPDATDAEIDAEDHARARACLGPLRLRSPRHQTRETP